MHILHITITAVILLYLQSSDNMKSKLKTQQFGSFSTHTVNSQGSSICEHGHWIYDAVGANYQVLLGIGQICW